MYSEKEIKKMLMENAVKYRDCLFVNLTTNNLWFDDGMIIPKGNHEVIDIFKPQVISLGKEDISENMQLETITYQGTYLVDEDWFEEFITNNNIYFIGSHILCNVYRKKYFVMTQILYTEEGKKRARAGILSTVK